MRRQERHIFPDEREKVTRNQTFLDEITKDLIINHDISDTMHLLGKKIARHFRVKWCVFSELVDDRRTPIVSYGWNEPDVPSLSGQYKMADFLSDAQLAAHNEGRLSIVSDVQNDSRVNSKSYGALGIRSFIIVPLQRNNEWHFMMSIIDTRVRTWRDEEVALINEITTRIWAKLERVRIEAALRKREAQTRAQKLRPQWELHRGTLILRRSN
jgi:GAF domain-containing protein